MLKFLIDSVLGAVFGALAKIVESRRQDKAFEIKGALTVVNKEMQEALDGIEEHARLRSRLLADPNYRDRVRELYTAG